MKNSSGLRTRYPRHAWGLVLIFTIFITGSAFSQNKEVDKLFGLSPFNTTTSDDQGYHSTHTVSGSGLNQPIKDTPIAIEVINEAFINDLGATNFEEALAYSSGVFLNDFTTVNGVSNDGVNVPGANEAEFQADKISVGGRFDNAATIRSFNVPHIYRDGFRYGGLIARYGIVLGGIVDTTNLQRMEIMRGPNSVIYGNSSLSGLVNIVAKRPKEDATQELGVGIGNEGYLRTTLDITGPLSENVLGGQLNYRFGVALEERDHWTDWRGKELDYYVGQLEWKSEKVRLLLEGQYADQRETGIGDQHIYDYLFWADDQNFRNEFGEHKNWTKSLGGFSESYRITGPDTYHLRREENLLADLEIRPLENFTISAGMFVTNAREEEFNVNLSSLTNREGSFNVKGVIAQRPTDPNTPNPGEILQWLDEFVTVFPNDHIERQAGDNRDFSDHRLVRYWWEKIPEESNTEQYRIRAAYDFESGFFGDSAAKHRFVIGRHDIKDEVDFTVGDASISRQFENQLEVADDDPLIPRNINDHRVIRYNGELLAMPGEEYRHMDVWTTRQYAQYNGQFFDERIGLTLGISRERFHARDRLWDRFDELDFFGNDYNGPKRESPPLHLVTDNPNNETFGFFPTLPGQDEYFPNQNQAEKTTTRNFALNYRLGDNITLYGTRSEGLLPPSGIRDGNGESIPAETSTNEELGIKFNLLGGRLTGTLSAYRITRDNASWYLDSAPAPEKWGQTPDIGFEPHLISDQNRPISYGIDNYYFEEEGVELQKILKTIFDEAGNPIGRESVWPEGLLGIEGFGISSARVYTILEYAKLDLPAIDRFDNETGKTWRYYLEKAFADRIHSNVLPDRSGSIGLDPIPYNRRRGTTLDLSPSDRSSRGANVTYTDQSEGVEMQLHYSIADNWQLIFSYARTERKAIGGFNLLDTIDPVSGRVFGTEYDIWVRTFGREAFGLIESDSNGDGVVDTITKNGQPVGLGDVRPTDLVLDLEEFDLYTGSKEAASLWTKYRFTEGIFKGFEASVGAIYRGPANTSTTHGAISQEPGTLFRSISGQEDFLPNPFGTPPAPDYFKVDTALSYQWKIKQRSFALQLNVYNLLNDTNGQNIIHYTDTDGSPIKRRTKVNYAPRSYRLSMSVDF